MPGSVCLCLTALAAATALSAIMPAGARGQGVWEALLTIDPYPSPYYSDWNANPNIGSLTVLNHGPGAGEVRVAFSIVDRSNRVIASGTSDPQYVAEGAAAIFDSPYEVAGTSRHDAEIERLAARTGRLPEGSYAACAAATDFDGFVLAEACAEFAILYPDPPLLLGPTDGDTLERQDDFFQWTPVQVPPAFDVQYVLRVAEVLEGQTPAEALETNIPHHESLGLFAPSEQYPIYARPLEVGTTYAWSVRAFDQNGYPVSANDGQSEIWTFTYDDGTAPTQPTGARTLTLMNGSSTSAAGSGATVNGLDEICAAWDDPSDQLSLNMNVPLGFDSASVAIRDVSLYQDSTTMTWGLLGLGPDRHRYLLVGDCDAGRVLESGTGGLRWIARRDTARVQPLGGFLNRITPVDVGTALGLELEDAIVILALDGAKVEVPSTWDLPTQFLNDRTIEVGPGLNVFGVLHAGASWLTGAFDRLGYPADAQGDFELQGFVGLRTSWSVGAFVGGRMGGPADSVAGGATGRVQAELIRLRGALPERPLPGGFFLSLQPGIELTVGGEATVVDTLDAAGQGGGSGGQVEAKLSSRLTLAVKTDDGSAEGVTWTGGLGVDLGGEIGETPSVAGVLALGTDKAWQLGQSGFYVGKPEAELELADLQQANFSAPDSIQKLSIKITGALGHPEAGDFAKVVVVFGRGATRLGSGAGGTSKMDSIRANIARLEGEIRTAEAAGDTARLDRLGPTLAIERNALAMWEHASSHDSVAPADTTATAATARWNWKAGVMLGNMSLSDFAALVRRWSGG
jgi:hypothetical protein